MATLSLSGSEAIAENVGVAVFNAAGAAGEPQPVGGTVQVELTRARAAINHTRAELATAAGTANPNRSTQASLNKAIA